MPDSSQSIKPIRVLSCVLCQQRKVRCDRTFPCANCVKSNSQCVPAGLLPRRRKRRFPERELLDRLRQYETLLRQNDVEFQPLHAEPAKENDDRESPESVQPEGSDQSMCSLLSQRKSAESAYEAKDFWNAVNQTSPESDQDRDSPAAALPQDVVKKAWDQGFETTDPLFGGENNPVDLSSHHPEPSLIFRLWQMYLERVDPLFKVTHTPSLQGRIVEAIADVKRISPGFEALMFCIYCMAVLSVTSDECEARLGLSRDELLPGYQRSCRRALINCGFLQSDDREILTALFFYLTSLRPTVGDPRTLSTALGMAIRIAKRLGIHSESRCARYPPLEAELRRRLWWALVLFDARIGEMADYRTTTELTPLWDCKIPSNVNDFDLRPEMKNLPAIQNQSSEALFIAARCAMADCLRNFSFYLDFTCPPLKAVAREVHRDSGPEYRELDALEKMMNERYLRFCTPDNPLHSITIWVTRGWLSKCRLFEHYSKYSGIRQSQTQRDMAVEYAIAMLDHDTEFLSTFSESRYLWMVQLYFPFPAYVHLLQDLRRRPLNTRAMQAWTALSENFECRANLFRRMCPGLHFCAMSSLVLEAWAVAESALRQSGQPAARPKIVTIMQAELTRAKGNGQLEKSSSSTSFIRHEALMPVQENMSLNNTLPSLGGNTSYSGTEMWMPFGIPDQLSADGIFASSDWSLINWGI
ncbi:uncharacterized protein DSM5745_07920 [Aspergillus mulundensis]|uniref:Zn(2)-C6 fungal-type domain-containing protein n=1 Tax=Aspergillus mulundensis TaxID=1810919 RepID=A0A3D8RFN2_9EURO|nr:hypothetical protein DSM5745_07920 [Aspergillus mulundensis]RDW72748.1 hypothetical protein DSM5745_07920 [Aspergillus mulundensis]